MPCKISSAMMPTRCLAIKKSNPLCFGCDHVFTRQIAVEISYETYEAFRVAGSEDVGADLARLAELAANQQLFAKEETIAGLIGQNQDEVDAGL